MKRVPILLIALVWMLFTCHSAIAVDGKLSADKVIAGSQVNVTGHIDPGQDLFVVICTDKMFSAEDSPGPKEKKRLMDGKNGKNAFGDTAIPSSYYVVTSNPEALATPKVSPKGQTSGIFAFPPFKYNVKVNKIKAWDKIDPAVRTILGPVNSKKQWEMLTYAHENKFGMNTIVKEKPSTGGNARMIMSDYAADPEQWNEGVSMKLDKTTGEYSVSMSPYKNLYPDTVMAVYVNGQKINTFSIEKSGFFFTIGNVYMNPLIVFGGAFIIGVLFVIMGAAGGLFTAAFQITAIGTNGPIGINAGNTIKPTNLFLTLCSPISGLLSYLKEKRFAYPVAIPFAVGIIIGAFFVGPPLSAKYLNLAAFKFYLGIICLVIGIKLYIESLPASIEKKKAMKAIVQKFNAAVKEAKESGKALELGSIEFDKFNPVKFEMRFWGETFIAKPLLMLLGGVVMGIIASSFGVGGGFMFMPFMTTLVGYPMYLAVPIALAGAFSTSVGGIAKYVMMGYQPDWIMAALIAAGAMCGGAVGPKLQKKMPEILLKRLLAGALILTCLKYTGLIWFMR